MCHDALLLRVHQISWQVRVSQRAYLCEHSSAGMRITCHVWSDLLDVVMQMFALLDMDGDGRIAFADLRSSIGWRSEVLWRSHWLEAVHAVSIA